MSSNSETAPAVAAPAIAPEATTPIESSAQPNKFSNTGKVVGSKVKGFFKVINNAGEQIRGNINAALDGTGDAIAGRKSGEVISKETNPEAPVAVDSAAPVAETSAAATAAVPETNTAAPAAAEKKYPVGQAINKSLKRTVTLIKRVSNNLRSNINSGVNGVGSTISEKKDRASKRFSRSRAPEPTTEQEPAAVTGHTTETDAVPIATEPVAPAVQAS